MLITLYPWEYQRACEVGIARYVANWGKDDAAHYDRDLMEDDRTATVAAAACEVAVARHVNRYWHGHVWHRSEHARYRHLPDVGRNIEVRRVRTGNRVAVRRSDEGKVVWAARAIGPEFRQVEALGWLVADEVLADCPEGQTWMYVDLDALKTTLPQGGGRGAAQNQTLE